MGAIMQKLDRETGDMILKQGDSFSVVVDNIDNDCVVYFSVTDEMNNPIFEISKSPENRAVKFNITATHSNLLIVPRGRPYARYNYAIKVCKQIDNEWLEDTLVIGNKKIGYGNHIIVYPLIAEGK